MAKRTRKKTTRPAGLPAPKRRAKRTRKAKGKRTTRTDAVRLTALEKTVASHGKRLDKVEKSVAIVTRAMKGYRK